MTFDNIEHDIDVDGGGGHGRAFFLYFVDNHLQWFGAALLTEY